MARAIYPLTLFYDAACPVCSLEMDHLRARNRDGRLVFIDISAPGFDAERYGVRADDMDAEIHGLAADGTMFRGMEVLRLAYDAAGLGWVLRATGWAPLRALFDAGYRVFARHRRGISRAAAPLIDGIHSVRARRTAERMCACKNGGCEVDAASGRRSS